MSAPKPPHNPLVVVLGATGTGKSNLAVELALRYNGEIINGDAMQLYEGLPIITNKIPAAERQGVPHHLLGVIGLDEPAWTVPVFVKKALAAIEGIRARGRLPILVGGTHYYTQSLLFPDALAAEEVEGSEASDFESQEEARRRFPILSATTPEILAELRRVDPVMADRWHPNDRRKIIRSLEIYLRTGKPASQVYAEQQARRRQQSADAADAAAAPESVSPPSSHVPGQPTRFPTLLLWAHTPRHILTERLDARVHQMVAQGLLDEVAALHAHANSPPAPRDPTRGIYVSIGYKEFLPYQSLLSSSSSCPPADPAALAQAKRDAIAQTQIATRQYARSQVRWLRIKLLAALASTPSDVPSAAAARTATADRQLFLLPTPSAEPDAFARTAVGPASRVLRAFLAGDPLPDPLTLREDGPDGASAPLLLGDEERAMLTERVADMARDRALWFRERCDVCGTTCVVRREWENHVRSKGHRRRVRERMREVERAGREEQRRVEREERRRRRGEDDVLGEEGLGGLGVGSEGEGERSRAEEGH